MNLEIRNLFKSFSTHELIKDLSFTSDASVLTILGPSGSGKSTLLKMIAGLDIPDAGEIFLQGQKVPFDNAQALLEYRRSLGVVFQSWNLFSHFTAFENIVLPLYRVHGYSLSDAQVKAKELLERFGLLEHAHKKPSQLSGGQNQRVAILRAVAHKPSLLLLDEPTSALDPVMTVEVLDLLFELKREGSSFILVSHHLPFIRKISDTTAFVSEGNLLACAPTKSFFENPSHPVVKSYLGTVLKYE